MVASGRILRRVLDGVYLAGGVVAAGFLIVILLLIVAQMLARWTGHVFPGATDYAGYAMAAASLPNGVTNDLHNALASYWSEEEIVEILGVVCMFGVFNRWNDSMATPLEAEPMSRAGELIGDKGWEVGQHG